MISTKKQTSVPEATIAVVAALEVVKDVVVVDVASHHG
jgi:hypothetical protein